MVITLNAEMLASDMLNLTMLPKGTILMYDGGGWQDNKTLVGWYQCNGQIANGVRLPDLRNKFIRGGVSFGATGGKDKHSITLDINYMPAHTHGVTDGGHVHGGKMLRGRIHDGRSVGSASCADGLWEGDTSPAKTGISLGSAGETNPSPVEINTLPSYYTVIYIKKMA
ncbi:MAG: hypothetical protein LBD99_05020 [Candidatus Margulisbacteria bacterium]|jgi:hypothetical protein|nr:hypothetical protein [Candidatus Margulisiibacteriota bacterium]